VTSLTLNEICVMVLGTFMEDYICCDMKSTLFFTT